MAQPNVFNDLADCRDNLRKIHVQNDHKLANHSRENCRILTNINAISDFLFKSL